jgi:hypothetical protein
MFVGRFPAILNRKFKHPVKSKFNDSKNQLI